MKNFKIFIKEELVNGNKGDFFVVKLSNLKTSYNLNTLSETDRDAIKQIIRKSKLPEPFKIIRFLAKSDGTVYLHGADITHRDLIKRAEPMSSIDIKNLFIMGHIFPGQCDLDWNFIGDISPENIDKNAFIKKYKTPEKMTEDFYTRWGWINSFVKNFLIKRNSSWYGELYTHCIASYIFNTNKTSDQ